jgi:hypothetical protein
LLRARRASTDAADLALAAIDDDRVVGPEEVR